MNCSEVTPLLSPFHDGELAAEKCRVVADHVASCAACSKQLEAIRRLSDLVESTPSPEAPRTLATKIERSLSEHASFWYWLPSKNPERLAAAVAFAFAVAAVLILSLAYWPAADQTSRRREEMVRNFDQFLVSFEKGNPAAVDLLAQRYQGVLANEVAATAALKRKTVARPVVFADHQIAKRYVLKMPCCKCVETIYTRGDATSLILFEHETDQPDWFGNRPMIRASCCGKACCVVQLKGSLAASWPVNGGFVTVVGPRDLSDFSKLVDELK